MTRATATQTRVGAARPRRKWLASAAATALLLGLPLIAHPMGDGEEPGVAAEQDGIRALFRGADLAGLDRETVDTARLIVLAGLDRLQPTLEPTTEHGGKALTALRDLARDGQDDVISEGAMQDLRRHARAGAEAGDPVARLVLGIADWIGLGQDHDLDQAMARFEAASAQGEGQATFLLGTIFEAGQGDHIEADPERAYTLYRRAAEQGSPDAAMKLYRAHLYGQIDGIEKDEAVAREYLEQAANTGHRPARHEQAFHRLQGELGYEASLDQALETLHALAEEDYAPAHAKLAAHYGLDPQAKDFARMRPHAERYLDLIEARPYATLDPSDYDRVYSLLIQELRNRGDEARAWRLAREGWEASGARSSAVPGQVAMMYASGQHVARDLARAREWALKSWQNNRKWRAEVMEAVPLCLLGLLNDPSFENMRHTKDSRAAVKWYMRCGEEGLSSGYLNAGTIFEDGSGVVPRSTRKARALYKRAIDIDGNPGAKNNLALLYFRGQLPEGKDLVKALELFKQSAYGGGSNGMAGYSFMLARGHATETDPYRCFVWATAAQLRGSKMAVKGIRECRGELTHEEVEKAEAEARDLHNRLPAAPKDALAN